MIFSLIYFAAALQGFLLALTLWLHKRNVSANHILACWLFCLSLDLLWQIYYAHAYLQYPHLIGVSNFLPLTYGSFLFLYVRTLIRHRAFQERDLIHFLPFVFVLLISFDYFLLSGSEKIQLLERIKNGEGGWRIGLIDWSINLVSGTYAFSSFWLFRKELKARQLGWLRVMLTINLIIWAFVWLSSLVPEQLPIKDNQLIYLLSSLFIYVLGYFSLKTPESFSTAREFTPKYGDNRLSDELRKQLFDSLEAYVQDSQIWRDSQLSLNQLADGSRISAHHISQVLNDYLGKSFNDYLNHHRINAVCQQLQALPNKPILEIALGCGFSSKSSFNVSFKKVTGLTPSDYRKSFLAESNGSLS